MWRQIEAEFAKAFKCKVDELPGREIRHKTRSYVGNPIEVVQKVIDYVPETTIAIRSENNSDIVVSRYTVTEVDETITKVELELEGKNDKSVLRSWNYWLMSLPVLRSGTKKRLDLQLNQLKSVIESEGA